MKHNIGYYIRKLRESRDLSQENMAAELELTTSAYSKIERGVTDPSAGRLLQIAEVLDVDASDFFKNSSDKRVKIDDPARHYGFATKSDIEEINHILDQLRKQNEMLRTQLENLARKLAAKKKR